MHRTAIVILSIVALVTATGCGGKINRVNFDKVTEIVNPKMNAKEALDWGEIEEILGGSGSKLDAKEFKKMTKNDPYKGAEIKIWRGKRGSWIAIQYDPKTNHPKGINGSVPR